MKKKPQSILPLVSCSPTAGPSLLKICWAPKSFSASILSRFSSTSQSSSSFLVSNLIENKGRKRFSFSIAENRLLPPVFFFFTPRPFCSLHSLKLRSPSQLKKLRAKALLCSVLDRNWENPASKKKKNSRHSLEGNSSLPDGIESPKPKSPPPNSTPSPQYKRHFGGPFLLTIGPRVSPPKKQPRSLVLVKKNLWCWCYYSHMYTCTVVETQECEEEKKQFGHQEPRNAFSFHIPHSDNNGTPQLFQLLETRRRSRNARDACERKKPPKPSVNFVLAPCTPVEYLPMYPCPLPITVCLEPGTPIRGGVSPPDISRAQGGGGYVCLLPP